jgi:hypothetical protein
MFRFEDRHFREAIEAKREYLRIVTPLNAPLRWLSWIRFGLQQTGD